MYNRILVPLDGSEFGECILQHVRSIAIGCHVPQVDLLVVVEPMSGQIYDIPQNWKDSVQKQGIESARAYLAKMVGSLSKDGINASAVVAEGSPADIILDYVIKNKVDLVMMSTHGRSGISRFAFGSVADKYIRESPVPVLIATPAGCRIG
jgi:nucleotide-binding universal stress UspA family protein